MAKPVTDYVVNLRIKGEETPPTQTVVARIIRNKFYDDGYEVTVRAAQLKPESDAD